METKNEALELEPVGCGVELPKPFKKSGQQMSYDGVDEVFFDCYTNSQLIDYGNRRAAEMLLAQAAEIEKLREAYQSACLLVADMHEAAMGGVMGPVLGVVEDVAALRAERDQLKAKNEKLAEALRHIAWSRPPGETSKAVELLETLAIKALKGNEMTTEREAFEAWINRDGDGLGYSTHDKRVTWDAWQASRKAAIEDAAKALHMVGNGRVFSSKAAGMAAWIKQQFEETIRSLK